MFMIADVDIAETRQGRMLARLASLSLELAESLQTRALAAETTEEAVKLAGAFHRCARSARQSLALEFKLIHDNDRICRDKERHDREFRAERERQQKDAVARRRNRVHQELEKVIWDEVEDRDTAHELVGDLYDELEEECRLDSFLDETVEAQIERLRRSLDIDEIAAIYREDDEDDEDEDAKDAAGEGAAPLNGVTPAQPAPPANPPPPDSS